VREHTKVVGLAEHADGKGFVLSLLDGSIHTRRVVLATGPFQRPLIPRMARDVSPSVLQTDPTRYRNPQELPDGAVLVVGTGASGCQIADELIQAGRRVFVSVSRHRRAPRRFRGTQRSRSCFPLDSLTPGRKTARICHAYPEGEVEP
jgi:putative flavoprotein involved in K+ transport